MILRVLMLAFQMATDKRTWEVILVVLMVLLSLYAACVSAFFGLIAAASTYPSKDEDMLAVDAAYSTLEEQLSADVRKAADAHPEFDEYRYNLAEIGHDEYVLASYLTTKYEAYTLGMVQHILPQLIARQYTILTHESEETRERIVEYPSPDDPNETIVEREEYTVRILTITLRNNRLGFVRNLLSDDQQMLYDVYIMWHGNRPDLFPQWKDLELDESIVPEELLESLPGDTDEGRRAVIEAALSGVGHIAYDTSQSRQPTGPGLAGAGGSLDCSRFIKWAYWTAGFSDWDADSTHTYAYASCVRQISRAELLPGDIAMLKPSGSGSNHVRIYMGDGYWIESAYGHGACVNNWTDVQDGGHAYQQFWRYVGFG